MTDPTKIKELIVGSQVSSGTPLVSVVIPNYNTAQFIAETLDSLRAQTFTNYEIIVVNDAAPDTDELRKVLEKYKERITFIDKSTSEGTSASRTLAVEHARGDVLAFLDADDIWRPTLLEELSGFLEINGFDMVY